MKKKEESHYKEPPFLFVVAKERNITEFNV